ncbi:MAG: PAS domain S-box protein [Sphingobacteriia bacterium]|nr:PAS domain S-box protein [Sphingobacteriia bacterium]
MNRGRWAWGRILAILALSALAIAGNHFNLSLFFGANVIFGSVAVLLAIVWLGPGAGLLVAAISATYTQVLWGHPLAWLVFVAEAGFVAWHRRHVQRRGAEPPPLVVSVGLYWILIGIPLVLTLYTVTFGVDSPQVRLIAFKQPLNGILNATLASTILVLVAIARVRPAGISVRKILFSLLLLFGLLPLMMSGARESRELKLLLERDLGERLGLFGRFAAHEIERWPSTDLEDPDAIRQRLSEATSILAESLPATADIQVAWLQSPTDLSRLGSDYTLPTAVTGLVLIPAKTTTPLRIEAWRQSRYRMQQPVSNGQLIMSVSATPLIDQVHVAATRFLAILLILSALWILASHYLSWYIVQPMQQLAKLARALPDKIVAGDPPNLPPPGRLSEYADLIRAIENMALTLDQIYRSLGQSEAGLKEAQAVAHLGSWTLDTRSDAVFWSDENYRLLGYPPGAITPSLEAFFAVVEPADAQSLRDWLASALANPAERYAHEFRVHGHDGETRILSMLARTHCDETGRLIRLIGTNLDISERKEVELALRMRERLEHARIELAQGFLATDHTRITKTIDWALARIGDWLGADRVHIIQLEQSAWTSGFHHEWRAPGSAPPDREIEAIARERHPELMRWLQSGRPIHCPSTTARPPEPSWQWLLDARAARSLVAVPLLEDGRLLGLLGIEDLHRPREWSSALLGFLQGVAEILATANQRARIEAALHAAHSELETTASCLNAIIEQAPIGIYLAGPDRRFILFNPSLQRILGRSHDQLADQSLDDLIHPDDLAVERARFAELVQAPSGATRGMQRCLRPDGSVILAEVWSVRLPDIPQTPPRVLGIVEDVTERRGESVRRHRLERAMMRHAGNLESLLDLSSRILSVTEEQQALLALGSAELGLDGGLFGSIARDGSGELQSLVVFNHEQPSTVWPEQLRHLPLAALMTELNAPVFLTGDQLPPPLRAANIGACVLLPQQQVSDPQAPSTLLLLWGRSMRPDLSPPDRELIRLIGQRILARHHQAELEHALIAARERETIAHLAQGVVHDFNNLLGVVGANLSYLQGMPGWDQIGAEATQIIAETQAALWRAKILNAGLLSMSGTDQIPLKAVRIEDTLGALTAMLHQIIPERIRLSMTSEPDLVAHTNAAFLQACVLNLVINARDAMPLAGDLRINAGRYRWDGQSTQLIIGHLAPGDYVEVSVTDTGSGIDKSIEDRLFEPWFSTKSGQRGRGLGLFMVHELVQRAGAGLTLRSAKGQGSRFGLLLPLPDGATWADTPSAVHPGAGSRVLVVENDPSACAVVGQLLTAAGMRVDHAEHGAAALELLRQDQGIALVLSDIAMPIMDGIELGEALAREFPHLPLILMTGQAQADLMVDRLPKHQGLLHKPITAAALDAALSRVVTYR